MLANYDFSKDNYTTGGWAPSGAGAFLSASVGDGFQFIYDQVPSTVNFRNPIRYGQLDARSTQWNGVTCPDPEVDQMYLNGGGAGLISEVLVDQTDRFTVEFWFKPDVSRASELARQGITHLITMEDVQYRAMTIYVENGVLKCSPYGRSKGFDLVYEGIGNPLEIDTWQHISCMFSN